jgi:hypothetical protein
VGWDGTKMGGAVGGAAPAQPPPAGRAGRRRAAAQALQQAQALDPRPAGALVSRPWHLHHVSRSRLSRLSVTSLASAPRLSVTSLALASVGRACMAGPGEDDGRVGGHEGGVLLAVDLDLPAARNGEGGAGGAGGRRARVCDRLVLQVELRGKKLCGSSRYLSTKHSITRSDFVSRRRTICS